MGFFLEPDHTATCGTVEGKFELFDLANQLLYIGFLGFLEDNL